MAAELPELRPARPRRRPPAAPEASGDLAEVRTLLVAVLDRLAALEASLDALRAAVQPPAPARRAPAKKPPVKKTTAKKIATKRPSPG